MKIVFLVIAIVASTTVNGRPTLSGEFIALSPFLSMECDHYLILTETLCRDRTEGAP